MRCRERNAANISAPRLSDEVRRRRVGTFARSRSTLQHTRSLISQIVSDCVCAIVHSAGQYGHLNRADREPRASFVAEDNANTWPHGSSAGGLPGVANSFEIGHVKDE